MMHPHRDQTMHHRHFIRYPQTLRERVYTFLVGPLFVLALVAVIINFHPGTSTGDAIGIPTLVLAALATLSRLLVAYLIAVAVSVPLAILVTVNPTIESLLLPVFDVFQSVPTLALFPVIIIVFVNFGNLEGAAVFVLFLSMLWNIVFTLVGGINVIPKEILAAARVFGLRGSALVYKVIVPSIVPQFVTGSLLAFAQGWNIIIVAEVLHTYIPGGTSAEDVFGIGSILVDAAAHAENGVFLSSVIVLVVIISLLNLLVWQRLLRHAQRFRFD